MIEKNKKLTSIIIAALIVFSLFAFAGCKPEFVEEKENDLILNYDTYLLDVYEDIILFAVDEKYKPIEIQISWSSSDDSIAIVDSEGKVTALKEGKAVITATSGDKKGECAIFVSSSNSVPFIKLNVEDTLNILKDRNFIINAELYYKEKLSNIVFAYIVEDDDIISVDSNGKVTGLSKGTTYLTIKTSWHDFDTIYTTKTIVVNVK